MGIPARRLAIEHRNCNVSLEIYNDTCLCLQCNDCDVIIVNFGPSCIVDEDELRPPPACDIGVLVAMVAIDQAPETSTASPTQEVIDPACEEIAVIDDFNRKFYESDNGQIQEGNENDEISDSDGRERDKQQDGRLSDHGLEAAGGICYFGKPPDDPDSGSPSEPDDTD
jgi:hypothetical protein